jgi:DNA-directed RNA polymerase subunit RPC12/RpoP
MKVIIEKRIITCCGCGTPLIYTSEDIETTWIGNKPFIRCPICGQKLFELSHKK